MKTDLIILDKNARDVLRILNNSKFPLARYSELTESNKLKLANSTLSEIVIYLKQIGYIQEVTNTIDDMDSGDQIIHLSYLGMFYEEIFDEYKHNQKIESIITPILVTLLTTLLLQLPNIIEWLSQLLMLSKKS
ncbi:MAG: hypothetical protein RR623_08380 [Bacilli bacterium]